MNRYFSSRPKLSTTTQAPYIRNLWDFLPWIEKKSMGERKEEVMVDAHNPGTLYKDYKEVCKNQYKYYKSKEVNLKLPNINGNLLNKNDSDLLKLVNGKNSLVLFKLRDIGELQLKSWRDPFLKNFPNQNCIDVTVMENTTYRLFERWLTANLRKKVPENRLNKNLVVFKEIPDCRLKLEMSNVLIGWAFLVDKKGIVRWKGHGKATQEEIDLLFKVNQKLLKE